MSEPTRTLLSIRYCEHNHARDLSIAWGQFGDETPDRCEQCDAVLEVREVPDRPRVGAGKERTMTGEDLLVAFQRYQDGGFQGRPTFIALAAAELDRLQDFVEAVRRADCESDCYDAFDETVVDALKALDAEAATKGGQRNVHARNIRD